MKNFVAWIFVLIALTGCMKEDKACTPVTPSSEEPTIAAFTTANNISASKHNSGIYYQVMSQGFGPTPTLNSEVTISYVGKLLDGTIFDQSNYLRNTLNKFIEGWQIGLPLVQKGGTIKLIIPSAYAYGCNRYGNIPPNSVLYFEITLIDVR